MRESVTRAVALAALAVAALLLTPTAARADLNQFLIEGRVCNKSFGCEAPGNCFYSLRVATISGAVTTVHLVLCDPAAPISQTACAPGTPATACALCVMARLGDCVGLQGAMVPGQSGCPTFLQAEDGYAYTVFGQDWVCHPLSYPVTPC